MAPPWRRSPWFRVTVVVGFLVPTAVLGALAAVSSIRSSSLAAQRRAFAPYEKAVDRAVQDGGFVVTQGMWPGISDIAEGSLPRARLVTMAEGWVGSMRRVRADLAAVEPPEFLAETARRYDAALSAYVNVAEALLAAARTQGPERAALVEKVRPLGRRADGLWSRAHDSLERERDRLGLGA